MSASVLIEFYDRLGDSWEALADAVAISTSDRGRFEQGNEPRRIVRWLTERRRLSDLEWAIVEIDRSDLSSLVAKIVSDDEATSARPRQLAPPRSIQHFEILFLSTHPELDRYELVLKAAAETTNAVALQPTGSYRFLVSGWDGDVHAIGSSRRGLGFDDPVAASDTVVVVIRRNPSASALETLLVLLEAEGTRAFVVVINNSEDDFQGEDENLSAARERHCDASHWIEISGSTEQTIEQVLSAIVCRLAVEIVNRGASGPQPYAETR